MSIEFPNFLHAAGRCSTTAQIWARGCVLAKSDTGIYTCTLDQGVDATECGILVQLETSGIAKYTHTSDTVKTIETFAVDGTTATDKAFTVLVFRIN